MAGVNEGAMALAPDDLNEMDAWLLDFLGAHEWATPNLLRRFYNDEHEAVSRQWVSARLLRLAEHGHVEKVHPEANEYRLVDDPREE